MALSDFLNINVPDLAYYGMGLYNARNANNALQSAYSPNQYDAMYQQLANQLQQLTGEMADTNNPQFKARVQARQAEIMRRYQQALQQQQALEARRYNRTGMGTINPERRDEALSRSLANYQSVAQAQARAEAMQELVNAANTTGQSLPHVNTGAVRQQGQQVAQANVGNAYDQKRKEMYMGLAQSLLGPLLKNVDLGKAVDAVFGTNQAAISPVPQMANTMYGMGDTSGLNWGASAGGGVPMPPTGGMPDFSAASFAPQYSPSDFGFSPDFIGNPADAFTMYGAGDATGNNLDWGASQGGGVPMPSTGTTPQFNMPSFDFAPPNFDFGNFNLDFSGLDYGTPDYGLGTGGWW